MRVLTQLARFRSGARRAAALIALCTACVVPGFAAGTRNTLSLTFEPHGGVVDGITPGGTIVVFARARKQFEDHYAESLGMKFLVEDKARTGRVVIDLGRDIPAEAAWTVVDLTTGRHVIQTRGAAARRAPLGAGAVQYLPQNGKLRLALAQAEVLIVRPGQDAWIESVGDGGSADEDGRIDGGSTMAPARLRNVRRKSDRQLDRIRKGDLVVVVDPATLRVWSSAELGE